MTIALLVAEKPPCSIYVLESARSTAGLEPSVAVNTSFDDLHTYFSQRGAGCGAQLPQQN